MNLETMRTLEYHKVKENIKEFTVSHLGKKLVDKITPNTNIDVIKKKLNDTTEAKKIINTSGLPPLQGLHDIEDIISKIEKGIILKPSELNKVSDFLRASRKMKSFMMKQDFIASTLSGYSSVLSEFKDIEDEINSSIEGSRVSSKASNTLSKIRRKKMILEEKIEKKVNGMLNSPKYKKYLQDSFVSKRRGKYVLPIKATYKNLVEGNVVEISATGSTAFIEPKALGKLSQEMLSLDNDEEIEEYQILSTVTGYIDLYIKEIKLNIELMAEYDLIFAKAKYALEIDAIEPILNEEDYIDIIEGRHPLLEGDVTPLDFKIGKEYRTLIITGPNTGGKTIALKTIGLLTLLAQSGIHVPAKEGTEICIFDRILVDIGDKQSIEQSLSTFSGHIENIINIMNKAKYSSLVLFDEIGTGTDPREGAGLAAAILHELYKQGSITVATTHYGEIKDFANKHKGFENGCMAFDPETLAPLYRLIIGKAGTSNALWISKKMGMKDSVLSLAEKYINSREEDDIHFDIKDVVFKRRINKENKVKKDIKKEKFRKGDSVILLDNNKRGVVYKAVDEFNNLSVLVDNKFIKVNEKRLKLHLKREVLYPEGYDLDQIFITWDERKLEKEMAKGRFKDLDEVKEKIDEVNQIKRDRREF
ncbi:endonuclease MutS2 [Dethiothermospora halolimnae]|uniref:endonuclease MutS2 n=1 Tax=Dethiothermospora halolimnae TaxID=3114390 RepID=UPI003CCC04A7